MSSLLDISPLIKLLRSGSFCEGSISIMTPIEILRGLLEAKRLQIRKALKEAYEIISLDNDVILECCSLYDEFRNFIDGFLEVSCEIMSEVRRLPEWRGESPRSRPDPAYYGDGGS